MMEKITKFSLVLAIVFAVSGCGDKRDSADRAEEAQKAIQQGVQKERALMEDMQKGVEDIEKKMEERKEGSIK